MLARRAATYALLVGVVRALAFPPQMFFAVLVGLSVFGEGDPLIGAVLGLDAVAGVAAPFASRAFATKDPKAALGPFVGLTLLDGIVGAMFLIGAGRVTLVSVPFVVFALLGAVGTGFFLTAGRGAEA